MISPPWLQIFTRATNNFRVHYVKAKMWAAKLRCAVRFRLSGCRDGANNCGPMVTEKIIRTMEGFSDATGLSRTTVSRYFDDAQSVRKSTRIAIEKGGKFGLILFSNESMVPAWVLSDIDV